jgi:hypothetical protein
LGRVGNGAQTSRRCTCDRGPACRMIKYAPSPPGVRRVRVRGPYPSALCVVADNYLLMGLDSGAERTEEVGQSDGLRGRQPHSKRRYSRSSSAGQSSSLFTRLGGCRFRGQTWRIVELARGPVSARCCSWGRSDPPSWRSSRQPAVGRTPPQHQADAHRAAAGRTAPVSPRPPSAARALETLTMPRGTAGSVLAAQHNCCLSRMGPRTRIRLNSPAAAHSSWAAWPPMLGQLHHQTHPRPPLMMSSASITVGGNCGRRVSSVAPECVAGGAPSSANHPAPAHPGACPGGGDLPCSGATAARSSSQT